MDITEDYKNQLSQAQFLKGSRESTIEREKTHSPSTPVQGKLTGFTNSSSIRKLSFGSLDNGSLYKGSDSGQKSPKHSSGTITMIFSLNCESTSPSQQRVKHIPNGDDVDFMILKT